MKFKNQQCSTAKNDAENRNVKIKNRNIKRDDDEMQRNICTKRRKLASDINPKKSR